MPDASPATPATGAPAATSTQPTAAAPAAPPAPANPELAEAKKLRDEAAALRKAAALEKRQSIGASNKWQEEKKQLGAKLSRLGELEKLHTNAKLDPASFAKSIYGENWYDVLTEAKINGVPPAAMIANEMEKVRSEVEQKFAAREEEMKKQQAQSQQAAAQQARRELTLEGIEFYKANAEEFGALEAIGDAQRIATALAQRIETEFNKSEQRDPATGEVVRPGRVISMKEAAELIEADVVALAEKVAGRAKYSEKLRAKLAPAPTKSPAMPSGVTQRTEAPTRKTLSNDLTASTPSHASPSLSFEQKKARAAERFAELRAKATS